MPSIEFRSFTFVYENVRVAEVSRLGELVRQALCRELPEPNAENIAWTWPAPMNRNYASSNNNALDIYVLFTSGEQAGYQLSQFDIDRIAEEVKRRVEECHVLESLKDLEFGVYVYTSPMARWLDGKAGKLGGI